MNIQPIDYLVHFSNVLLLVSYSVRDILWAVVFTAINLYQISRIYLERRPVVLSGDEQRLYALGFQSLRPREFVALTLVGEWKSGTAGEKVLTEGEPVSRLCIPIAGSAEVRKQGKPVG